MNEIEQKVARCIRNIELLIEKRGAGLTAFQFTYNIKISADHLTLGSLYQLSELLDVPVHNLLNDDLEERQNANNSTHN